MLGNIENLVTEGISKKTIPNYCRLGEEINANVCTKYVHEIVMINITSKSIMFLFKIQIFALYKEIR